MKRLALAVIASVALSGTAFAADLAPRAVEPIAPAYLPFSWTGFYVGAQAGYAWGDSVGGDYAKGSGAVDVAGKLDPKGAFGGLHAGYNYQFGGNFVAGVEADVNIADIKGSASVLSTGGGIPVPPNSAKSDMRWNGSARLRLGYAVDRFLPYVTGGVAFGDYRFQPTYAGTGPLSNSNTLVGWTVGGGLEYAFTNNWTARIEYRYTDYGKEHFDIPGFPLFESRAALKTSDVRIGISYKF